MWGTEIEIERKNRIDVAAYAYAYEVENDPLIADAEFDMLCLKINPKLSTGNKRLDTFFKKEFDPCTGMWVRKHPDIAGLKKVLTIKRQQKDTPVEPDKVINLAELAKALTRHLDDYTAKLYDDGHRKHLGASVIGDKCMRKLWYGFRWVRHAEYTNHKTGEDKKGQMLRLFNRGHKEEFRLVEWLRGMGFTVEEFDPESRLYYNSPTGLYSLEESYDQPDATWEDVTGDIAHQERAAGQGVKRNQLRITDVNGHYGGSLDAIVGWPEYLKQMFGEIPDMLGEFKTANDKSSEALKKNGMRQEKPVHYVQMCTYGKRYGLRYGLYMSVNKNDDYIHIEIIPLDWRVADAHTGKAALIIGANTPPEKLHQNSAHFDCKYACNFAPVCHGQAAYDKNCRSCKFSAAVENKQWACAHFGIIPDEFIAKGCDHYQEAR